MVPLRYFSILLTATQWASRGGLINWQTWLTEKLISGLVIVAYCRAPTTDLYMEGSVRISVPCFVSLQQVTIGEEIGFASDKLVLDSRSWIYFGLCEDKRPTRLMFDLSKEIVRATKIFEGESIIKLGNKLLQQSRIITCNDYVINIDQHIKSWWGLGIDKKGWITLAGLETKLQKLVF